MRPEAIHKWNPRRTVHSGFWDFSQAVTNEIPISLNLQGFKKSYYKNCEFEFNIDYLKEILKQSEDNNNLKEVLKKIMEG